MLWWSNSRKSVAKAIRRGFDSLFLLVGWLLWKKRNARTFNRVTSTATQLAWRLEDTGGGLDMDCSGQQAPGDFGTEKDGTRGRNVAKPVHDVVPVAFST